MSMDEREADLLTALAGMAVQYLQVDDELDSLSMSAGERAIRVLAEHGLVEPFGEGRCARWTEAGRSLLRSR